MNGLTNDSNGTRAASTFEFLFYRVPATSSKAFPELGMGLYISSEIIKRHGGKITVESEEGKGSTFSVSLPLITSSSL